MPFKHVHRTHRSSRLHRFRPPLAIVIIAIVMIVGLVGVPLVGTRFLLFAHAAPKGGPVKFQGTIAPLVAHSHLLGTADPDQRISLSIGLRPRNQTGLASYVQDIYRPGSINYHRYLTPAQFAGVFGPGQSDYDALRQLLQASGFTITHTYSHRLLISFMGTIGQAEHTFRIAMKNYATPNGRVFYANDSDPVLPASLAGIVQSISGLNNAVRWQHPPLAHGSSKMRPQTASCLIRGRGYVTPDQTAAAYNLNGLYSSNYHGEGQTVALFELNTFSLNDLQTYASCFGQSHTPIQTIVTGSGKVPTDDGVVEVELDAELVLSAAPQLGLLKIYEAANDSADYNAEWAQILQDAPPIVSTSWGDCEQNVGQMEAQQENVYFMAAAAQGQSIFSASGDSGSAVCAFDQPPQYMLNTEDPAAQPFVTGVGGTTLSLSSNATTYGRETTWNNPPDPAYNYSGGASGGGISHFWVSPLWQNSPGVHNSFSSGTPCNAPSNSFCRESPDVALNADPNIGYAIYCSVAAAGCSSNGAWYSVGGTSAGAPMWAAMMAMANEMSLKQGGFNLGFVNPLLYQVASDPNHYAASFHDITTGTNDFNNYNSGSYPASANYDLATGLGSYNAYWLAFNLVTQAQNAPGLRASPTSTTWYFGEGSVGGGFQEYITLQNPSATRDARVAITYLFQSRAAVTVTHTVSRSSRATVSANADLNIKVTDKQQPISVVVHVTSGPGIVAERPMYFNFKGIQSGTDVLGATAPGTSFYFAEADTTTLPPSTTYYTYITILNPSSTQTATATLTFYTGSCGQAGQAACLTQTVVVPPLHRGTGTPLSLSLSHQMAIKVTSDQPVVVERPMYFRDTIPTAGGVTTGAASEVGATAPGMDWLFAEGYTGTNFQETFVLANFGTTATTAHVKLEYSNGHTQSYDVMVAALGQTYFDVNNANAHPLGTCDTTPCQVTSASSAEITSDAPIVADRLMFFHYGGAISGGTDTVGEPGPASHSVYAFAEGYTANTFQEFLTLQNPTDNDEIVAVTLFADTYVMQQQVTVKAHSRQTVNVNGLLVPIARAHPNMGANSYSVSVTVQALGTGAKVVIERPMYFNYYGDQGGTDAIGYTG